MRNFLGILLVLLLNSCDKSTVYSEYKGIPDAKWSKNNSLNFTFTTTDSITKNNVFLNLRNNKDYDYRNIFLIIAVEFPNGKQQIDTLEYAMADINGYYLGNGFTDIKESKLIYKSNTIFPIKGDYHFKVQQAMRKNGEENGLLQLNGITDVGISIEKIK